MGKIKGFLFAVRHREILMTDLGLYLLEKCSFSHKNTLRAETIAQCTCGD